MYEIVLGADKGKNSYIKKGKDGKILAQSKKKHVLNQEEYREFEIFYD